MLNVDDRLIKEVMPIIGANAFAVMFAISAHMSKGSKECFPGHRRLMVMTGLSRDKVYTAFDTLKNNGLLEVNQDRSKGNFARRTFKLTTKLLSIYVTADQFEMPENQEDRAPLPEQPEAVAPEAAEPYTVVQDTYLLNKEKERLNNIEKGILSESENSDGATFQVDIYEKRTETVTVEATPKSEPSPTVPAAKPVVIAIPKRDNNDPRPHLEAERKNLLAEFEGTKDHFSREMIKGRGIKIAAEIQLEDNIDTVVNRLNEKAKMPRGYALDKKETRTAIRKQLKSHTLEDLFTVIDFKCREWKDDAKFRQYLRPDTLFNGHFEAYLIAALQDKQNPLKPKEAQATRLDAPQQSTKRPTWNP